MSRQKEAHLAADAARAIDRVLLAERQAETSLAQARLQADQELERAREDALATVNRAMDRIAAWQQAHAQALQGRLARLRARAEAQALGLPAPDASALETAVQTVASRLCGGTSRSDEGDGPQGGKGPGSGEGPGCGEGPGGGDG